MQILFEVTGRLYVHTQNKDEVNLTIIHRVPEEF